jgi:sterol desaturase/sphingolipid hydroxylase (fatty acid hydroxylase superfamily)
LIKLTLDSIWGMYMHANIEIRDGVSFATKFAWWDWLFGIAFRPARKPTGFGLTDPFPSGYVAQQLYAFLPRSKVV